MNRITLLIAGIMLFTVSHGYAQSSYSIKVETGFLRFQKNTIDVDPGPNWLGYNLYKQNGLDFNIVNGLDLKINYLPELELDT